jgi:hypothetical protein
MRISIEIVPPDAYTRSGPAHRAPRPRRRGRRLALTLLLLGVIGAAGGFGVYSAFTATTTNTGNSFAAGSVAISDNDSGTAMLSLANAKPGDADSSCMLVTYDGSLPSTVRMYGSSSGGLTPYLTLTITRGTDSSPAFDSCTNFTADATNYIGAGAGIVYQGSLSSFPSTWAAGVVDPTTGSPESWTTSESHSFKYTITVDDNNSAQSQTANASFTWEARNQ